MKKIFLLIFVSCFLFLGYNSAQTVIFQEDFNSGLPGTWSVTASGNATHTWDTTSSYYSFSFDATKFMLAYDWNGLTTNEILSSPSFDASTSGDPVILTYDFRFSYQSTSLEGYVDVFDGATWQNVRMFSGTDTSGTDSIDVSTYANASMQVRFRFVNSVGNAWEHAFMIDNVEVDKLPATAIAETGSEEHSPYPNPSNNTLTIQNIKEEEINFIGIYSINGDLIKTCEKKTRVDISGLDSGSYILRVIANGEFTDDMLFIKQ